MQCKMNETERSKMLERQRDQDEWDYKEWGQCREKKVPQKMLLEAGAA